MLLAVSFVSAVSGRLSSSIYTWSKPLDPPQQADSFLDVSNPALWVVVLSLLMLVFLHFVFSGEAEE
jgi:hypothetical protein